MGSAADQQQKEHHCVASDDTSPRQQQLPQQKTPLRNARKLDYSELMNREHFDLNCKEDIDVIQAILTKPIPSRTKIDVDILYKILRRIKFFVDMEAEVSSTMIKQLLKNVSFETIEKREAVFDQGEIGSKFYIILQGAVKVLVPSMFNTNVRSEQAERTRELQSRKWTNLDEINDNDYFALVYPSFNAIATLKAGFSFGEIALRQKTRRTATIVCSERCTFATVTDEVFQACLSNYYEKIRDSEIAFLQQFHLFKDLFKQDVESVLMSCEKHTATQRSVIFRKGEMADSIYFLQSGEVQEILMISVEDLQHAKVNQLGGNEEGVRGWRQPRNEITKSVDIFSDNAQQLYSSCSGSGGNRQICNHHTDINDCSEEGQQLKDNKLFLFKSGILNGVSKRHNAINRILMAEIMPNSIFGEEEAFSNIVRETEAVVKIIECVYYRLSMKDFNSFMSKRFSLAQITALKQHQLQEKILCRQHRLQVNLQVKKEFHDFQNRISKEQSIRERKLRAKALSVSRSNSISPVTTPPRNQSTKSKEYTNVNTTNNLTSTPQRTLHQHTKMLSPESPFNLSNGTPSTTTFATSPMIYYVDSNHHSRSYQYHPESPSSASLSPFTPLAGSLAAVGTIAGYSDAHSLVLDSHTTTSSSRRYSKRADFHSIINNQNEHRVKIKQMAQAGCRTKAVSQSEQQCTPFSPMISSLNSTRCSSPLRLTALSVSKVIKIEHQQEQQVLRRKSMFQVSTSPKDVVSHSLSIDNTSLRSRAETKQNLYPNECQEVEERLMAQIVVDKFLKRSGKVNKKIDIKHPLIEFPSRKRIPYEPKYNRSTPLKHHISSQVVQSEKRKRVCDISFITHSASRSLSVHRKSEHMVEFDRKQFNHLNEARENISEFRPINDRKYSVTIHNQMGHRLLASKYAKQQVVDHACSDGIDQLQLYISNYQQGQQQPKMTEDATPPNSGVSSDPELRKQKFLACVNISFRNCKRKQSKRMSQQEAS